jgi:transmembrane sensor
MTHSQTQVEEAAAWALRLRETAGDTATDDVWAEFELWVTQAPEHMSLFLAAEDDLDTLADNTTSAPVMALRREAMQRARASQAHSLRLGALKLDRRAAAAVAIAVVAGPAAMLLWAGRVKETLYQTGVGEQKTLTLADGSSVVLDASSQIKVALSKDLRLIQLVSGRVFFDVARDKSRPFRVKSGDRAVTALGTAFSVEQAQKALIVTLLEGRVAVSDPRLSGPIEMKPDQELRLSEAARPQLRRPGDIGSQLKWREGQIYFDDVDIESAVARMNTYSRTPIVIVDASIARLRISGMFKANDPEGFTEALKSYFQLEITRTPSKIMLRTRQPE